MALGKAIDFVKQVKVNDMLRTACNSCESKDVLMREYDFNVFEFEDAINMQLVKCQTYDEADEILHIKLWFALL